MSASRVLVVDDEAQYRELLRERLGRKGYQVLSAANGEEALRLAAENAVDVALLDIMMPGIGGLEVLEKLKDGDPYIEAVVLTGHANVDSAIHAMKLGAFDYLAKPYKLAELDVVVERAAEKRRLHHRCAGLAAEIQSMRERSGVELVGGSPAWRRVLDLVHRAATADVPVLVTGESGVGKEKVAAALHHWGPRKDEPFVPVDCGALPEHLVESELFGHRRGAFTGSVTDKEGLFQTAGTGTILLDEIGELPPASQAKLLRVLETGQFRPLGHTVLRHTAARVIAATNRDLAAEVAAGRFRQDLFYRLNVLNVHVPPLRERRDDVPALATHFLQRSRGRAPVPVLAAGAVRRLLDYPWPGNIRELRNVMERLLLVNDGPVLGEELLTSILSPPARPAAGPAPPPQFPEALTLDEMQARYAAWVTAECGGNISTAAKRLGISRSRLYRLLSPPAAGAVR